MVAVSRNSITGTLYTVTLKVRIRCELN